MTPCRILLATGFLIAVSGHAQAQGNPSADQIINSLKPGGSMMGGTRGIRPVGPAPAAEAPPAPIPGAHTATAHGSAVHGAPATAKAPAVATANNAAAAPSVNLTVQFASNSAALTPAAVKTLSELGRALSSNTLGAYRFRIEGHTDTVGAPEANKALSERRAQTVVSFLETQFKIDPARLDAVGMGQDGLLVQTQSGTAEPRNRRVQVINLGA